MFCALTCPPCEWEDGQYVYECVCVSGVVGVKNWVWHWHGCQPSTQEAEARVQDQLVLQSCVVYVGRNLKITCQVLTVSPPCLSYSCGLERSLHCCSQGHFPQGRWVTLKLSSLCSQWEGPWVSKRDSLGRLAGEKFAKSWWCLCPVLGSGWQEAGEGTPAFVLSPNCLKFPAAGPKAPHILVRGKVVGGTGAGGPGTWLVRSEWPSGSMAGRVCCVAAGFVAWGQGWLAEPLHLFLTPHPSCKTKVVG